MVRLGSAVVVGGFSSSVGSLSDGGLVFTVFNGAFISGAADSTSVGTVVAGTKS